MSDFFRRRPSRWDMVARAAAGGCAAAATRSRPGDGQHHAVAGSGRAVRYRPGPPCPPAVGDRVRGGHGRWTRFFGKTRLLRETFAAAIDLGITRWARHGRSARSHRGARPAARSPVPDDSALFDRRPLERSACRAGANGSGCCRTSKRCSSVQRWTSRCCCASTICTGPTTARPLRCVLLAEALGQDYPSRGS